MVGEGIMVDAFVVITVNTILMAHCVIIASALADMEMSVLMCVVLTHINCL
jgi:hypothetical protein